MSASTPITIHLTERAARIVELSPSSVAYLLDRHRYHLQLEPTGLIHQYRLRARGVVGVIVAPDCRLIIAPKIPLDNLFVMLSGDEPVRSKSDQLQAAPADELVAFLASRFARLLRERIEAGLHWAYVETQDVGAQLHGRFDVASQVRQSPGRMDRLHSLRDDITVDLPCNQVPRTLAERMLAWPGLDAGVSGALNEALRGLDEVQSVPWPLGELNRLAEEPPSEDYRPLLEFCALLAEGLVPGQEAGTIPGPSFLLNLERVFETFVTRGVVQAFADRPWRTEVQRTHVLGEALSLTAPLLMRPDVIVRSGDRVALVVDAKWKPLPGGMPRTADLDQMLAYATGLGATRLVLVHPGARNRAWKWRLPASGVEVQTQTLRMTGTARECQRALRLLGRRLRREAIDRLALDK